MIARVNFKEVGKKPSSTSYIGDELTEEFIINFFGLNEPDIESYDITIT